MGAAALPAAALPAAALVAAALAAAGRAGCTRATVFMATGPTAPHPASSATADSAAPITTPSRARLVLEIPGIRSLPPLAGGGPLTRAAWVPCTGDGPTGLRITEIFTNKAVARARPARARLVSRT